MQLCAARWRVRISERIHMGAFVCHVYLSERARQPNRPERNQQQQRRREQEKKKELHIMAIGNNNISDRKKHAQRRMHTHAHTNIHTAHAVPCTLPLQYTQHEAAHYTHMTHDVLIA